MDQNLPRTFLHNQYCHIEQADLVKLKKNVPILNIRATFPNELDLDEPLDIIEWFWILKPKMTWYGFLRLKTIRNCQWPHPELYCGSYLVIVGPKLAIYTTILSFLHMYCMDPGVSTSLSIWSDKGMFWLLEAQNHQKPFMNSSRIIF